MLFFLQRTLFVRCRDLILAHSRANSGETRRSRPSDQASPRRDLQKQAQTCARALAQAESFRLSETPSRSGERGSPKRGRVGV
ncbi:hypothetical protein DEO72_LG2g4163 [Vigna unguiculata]|uniref:Uncharacterized protein n=1 Tax=Vigna unguiculata TaxID=3917 RepID=A0A4D6L5R6_VIGUN|nr:hypothetical protein DEO72_LG2g4163 [Vigna unguiculata]